MATCQLCFMQKETQPIRVHDVEVQVNLCRGCRITIDRTVGFIESHGYLVSVSKQLRLIPAAETEGLVAPPTPPEEPVEEPHDVLEENKAHRAKPRPTGA